MGDPVYAELALKALEQAFNPLWLGVEGKHPLKKLWARPDRLATSELFIFGSAIKKVQKLHPEWLKKTIKKVRGSEVSSGFITEIITCAQLVPHRGTLHPAMNRDQPGYDLEATYDHGIKHFISVKNQDVSDSQKKFTRNSKLIRNQWKLRLKLEKANLSLRVIEYQELSDADFEDVIQFIQKGLNIWGRQSVQLKPYLNLVVAPLHYDDKNLSKEHVSETVMVVSPGPQSEQLRFRRSIRAAADNMKAHIAQDEKSFNVVFMRVHVNADIDYLRQVAQDMINEGDSGIDGILFYQPSFGRDPEEKSLITNTFQMALNMRFIEALERRPAYELHAALGTGSIESSKLIVQIDGVRGESFPPNTYVFQEGDLYVVSDDPTEGNMKAPAMGIREHAVMYVQGSRLDCFGKIFPMNDDLLII